MLDGILAVGPQSAGFTPPTDQRIKAYRELVSLEK
jgi:hypothetical protein